MKQWLRSLVPVLGAAFLFSSTGHAQFVRDFQLNLFVAGTAYTDNNFEIGFPQSVTPIPGNFRLTESIRGGVRTNVYTRGHWGQEFFYSYEPNQITLARRSVPETSLKLDTQIHNFGVNALYYFSSNDTRRVRPFVSIGLGGTVYRPAVEAQQIARDPFRGNLPDLDTSVELAMNYGVGVNGQISRTFGVRTDVRGFLSRNPSMGFARKSDDPNATVLPATGAIHNLEVSAGVVFYFQRR